MAKKILLADDSITIQKVVELTFSDGDYEIVAVNNGSKAIQKLQEWRPDIILSDIIMPEKNGYEVCEFVKSHPDFKTIPVILLTGTFEPFDPDRAERAGCDAVVTKPFESQSLIHKVEELVAHDAPAEPTAAAVPPSPFDDTHSERRSESVPASQDEEPFAEAPPPSPQEIFGAPEPPPLAMDRSGSVFDETNPPRPASEAPAAPLLGGEPQPPAEEAPLLSAATTAFPKMSFDDLQRMRDEVAAPPEPEPPAPEAAPEPAAPLFSAETTAFPKMSFDELQRMRDESFAAPSEPAAPPPLEWPRPAQPEPEPSQFSAPPETAAEPSGFGFDAEEPKVIPFEPPAPTPFAAPEPEPEPEPQPVYSAETTAFPKLSFDDLQRMRDESAAPKPPAVEELPWTSAPEPLIGGAPEAPAAEPEGIPFAPPMPESAPAAPAERTGALSDEDVDRIARRVVELMSDKAIRDIAWEVIPDLAQSIVRERIRELEKET